MTQIATSGSKDLIDNVDEEQEDVVKFLSNGASSAYRQITLPESYSNRFGTSAVESLRVADIDIVSTHSAHLFLGEHIVYKIKRLVQYSYLDTRNIEDRRRFCQRELELNQDLLPHIYIDVLPITREKDGSLEIDGHGQIIEWAVRMKRFDEQCVLENIATNGLFTNTLARTLGESVAQFHNALGPELVDDGYQRMLEIINELMHEFKQLNTVLPSRDVKKFEALAADNLSLQHHKLDKRAENGYIRRCHGDLHLRNVLLDQDQPVPFDALEFSERLGTCDILYDFAFLLMDVGQKQLYSQQNRLLNAYLLYTPINNTQSLDLLGLFLSCRAAIRAMTTAQAAMLESDTQELNQHSATRYLDSAIRYLSRPTPFLVAIGGLSGTGKSTVAKRLSSLVTQPPGAVLIQSDAERKIAAGIPLSQSLPAEHYTEAASANNYNRLAFKAHAALSAGCCVIVDATFLGNQDRLKIEGVAKRLELPFYGIWLNAAPDMLRSRVAARKNDVSDASLEVLEHQLQNFADRPDWAIFDSAKSEEQLSSDCHNYIRSHA